MRSLGHQIVAEFYSCDAGCLNDVEYIKESVQSTPAGLTVAMPPELATRIFRNVSSLVDQMIANGQQPVVLTAPHVRLAFRKLTASSFPTLYVIAPDGRIVTNHVGVVTEDELEEALDAIPAGSATTRP